MSLNKRDASETLTRIRVWFLLIFLFLSFQLLKAGEAGSTNWSFDQLRSQAAQLAKRDYQPADRPTLPENLAKLDYDQYQRIQFKPESSPWHEDQLPFEVNFIHRGFIFVKPLKMHLVEEGQVQDVRFSPSMFKYGDALPGAQVPDG